MLNVKAVSGLYPPPYTVADAVKRKTNTLMSYFKSTPIKIGETVLGEAVQKGSPVFIRNTEEDKRMKQNTNFDTLYISSLIAVPLVISKRIFGLLTIVKRTRDQFFDDYDLSHLKTFAEYASLNIDNLLTYIELIEKRELEKELGIAAEIQRKTCSSDNAQN